MAATDTPMRGSAIRAATAPQNRRVKSARLAADADTAEKSADAICMERRHGGMRSHNQSQSPLSVARGVVIKARMNQTLQSGHFFNASSPG